MIESFVLLEGEVSKDVTANQIATEHGYKSLEILKKGYHSIEESMGLVELEITEEFDLVSMIVEEFAIIDGDLAEIAAVLEENSARFQEISSITDIQVKDFTEVSSSMDEINNIAIDLESTIK